MHQHGAAADVLMLAGLEEVGPGVAPVLALWPLLFLIWMPCLITRHACPLCGLWLD
jgi:hypothetical protein